MVHEKSEIKMYVSKGTVKIKVKETYKDNADGKVVKTFPNEVDLNNDNLEDVVQSHALSWIRGDWIDEDVME